MLTDVLGVPYDSFPMDIITRGAYPKIPAHWLPTTIMPFRVLRSAHSNCCKATHCTENSVQATVSCRRSESIIHSTQQQDPVSEEVAHNRFLGSGKAQAGSSWLGHGRCFCPYHKYPGISQDMRDSYCRSLVVERVSRAEKADPDRDDWVVFVRQLHDMGHRQPEACRADAY